MSNPIIKFYAVTIDCREPQKLADFYAKLLGWTVPYADSDYACLGAPNAAQGEYPGLTFQRNTDYIPPVWPEEYNKQQTMEHLDFAVDDIEKAVEHAKACGAVCADMQFSDDWRVMLDIEGHPFCLVGMKPLIDSEGFALR